MRVTHPLFLAILCLLLMGYANAQTKTAGNADLKQSIKNIAALFKKKKDSTTIHTAGQNQGTPAGSDTKTTGNYTIIANGGQLAPGAKSIDADMLYNFNGGSAMLVKGDASGLIDAEGNFVLPYHTYKIMNNFVTHHDGYKITNNGMYLFWQLNSFPGGYINAAGKIIMKDGGNNAVTDYSENKLVVVSNLSTHNSISYAYYTPDGKAYKANVLIENIVDGTGIVRQGSASSYYTYVYRKLTGEVISTAYDDAAPFSDGMARVGLRDAYGVMKYGFINNQGKLVIPCMFTEMPTDFSGGFARVVPKDKSSFEYAFINKTGEIVLKQTTADVAKYGTFDHFTNYGMAFTDRYIMDTTFSITPVASFFKSFGIPEDSWFVGAGSYTVGESNPKLVFATRLVRSNYTQQPVYGFINLVTRKVVMPVFDFINTNGLYFDPVSHLAYAKICTGRNTHNALIYREGYINEDGMFVLVKGQESQW